MTLTTFRRHNRENCDSKNRYDPRCGCPLHVQFVWKGAPRRIRGQKAHLAEQMVFGDP